MKNHAARSLGRPVPGPKASFTREEQIALTNCLLPPVVQRLIQTHQPDTLIVIPDGALHELPFEALRLERGTLERFVLDEMPPITYAPSARILAALQRRAAAEPETSRLILSVGNPDYRQAAEDLPQTSLTTVTRSAFVSLGGSLQPLPGTEAECRRLVNAFGKDQVAVLTGSQATEQNVRMKVATCSLLHLAAHGFAEEKHENLFGAIALTPPRGFAVLPENDGFLSVHEIASLPLTRCELVVLSGCQTNVGPESPLESGSTLARAFLVAGARRVISSLWRVDDASTAELIGTFFDQLAEIERARRRVNYAQALQAARKRVRADPQWSSPYYWAPFILTGPAESIHFR
jgi:CHAT domain-containing protein